MPRPRAELRPARRRRSALRNPTLLDRMDVADDAEGRVVIFSLDNGSPDAEAPPAPPIAGREGWMRGTTRLSQALDNRYAAVFVAAVLAGVLVLGLLLTRR